MIEWIKVSDRLPEFECAYFVWAPRGCIFVKLHAEVRWFRPDTQEFESWVDGEDAPPVSHWAVIEEPKEEFISPGNGFERVDDIDK